MELQYEEEVHKLVEASTDFGFKLFAEVSKQDSGKNIFLSPLSVYLALAMTLNGARNETREAMAEVLALKGTNVEEVNQASAALQASLAAAGSGFQLHIANSLWARRDVTFKPEFLRLNRDYYGAEIANLDFKDPNAPATINRWVNEKTGGTIPQIIERIDPLAVLFLINAIYFKGYWQWPFEASSTKDGPFTLLDGRQKQWPMMHMNKSVLGYHRGEGFEAVSLPYISPDENYMGVDGMVRMVIFLPDRDSSLEELQETLTVRHWEAWVSSFRQHKFCVVLPRFKIEYEIRLSRALSSLGMGVAFDKVRADFGDMCPIPPAPNVSIDEVKHKTFVEVDELGTEAAAVTSVEVMAIGGSSPPPPPPTIVIDRPFFYAIWDNQTGALLFMGSVVEPM